MKAQTSLRIGTVSPGHTLYALTKCGIMCMSGQPYQIATLDMCFKESTVKARRSRLCHNEKSSFIGKLSMHVCEEATSEGSVEPFKRYHQSVKQFRYRSSGLTFILSTWSWVQTVCKGYQQIPLAVKELIYFIRLGAIFSSTGP